MGIDVSGNKAVTLRRLDHACAAGELFVGESSLDIEDFGRAVQSADDEGSEGVVVVEGDIGGYSPSLLFAQLSEGRHASLKTSSSRRL